MLIKFKNYKSRRIFGAALLLVGATLDLLMLGLQEDYSDTELVVYCLIGLAMLILGIVELIIFRRENEAHDMDFSEEFDVRSENNSRIAEQLEQFRNDYAGYFADAGIRENSPVQNDSTQIFKNILDLQKIRLDRLGINMEFRSVRKEYTDDSIRMQQFSDRKYAITEVDEEIEAKRKYTQNGKKLFVRTSNQAAHYTILDAKRVGDSDKVLCPNCGNEATRENLIDGCDFCGTKFKVEDLDSKVSSFSFRDKYEIAHAKYKSLRFDYAFNANMIFILLGTFFFMFCMLVVLFDEPGGGDVMNPFFWTFSFIAIGLSFGITFDIPFALFYSFVIFPMLDISASFKYNSKRKLKVLKQKEEEAAKFTDRVREFDKLFSAADFVSDVQNKISSVIFAGNAAEINTFAQTDLSAYLTRYGNVVDYDLNDIIFDDFSVDGGLQKMDLTVKLNLFRLIDGKKIKCFKETLNLKLVKSAECKTQTVCAPRIMRCSGCGHSLSFANGLKCEYCGTSPDLKEYDWVIAEYRV